MVTSTKYSIAKSVLTTISIVNDEGSPRRSHVTSSSTLPLTPTHFLQNFARHDLIPSCLIVISLAMQQMIEVLCHRHSMSTSTHAVDPYILWYQQL
jgi:hypothetical protein